LLRGVGFFFAGRFLACGIKDSIIPIQKKDKCGKELLSKLVLKPYQPHLLQAAFRRIVAF
jgi:hypothetical protein